jgi:hypothetical protein
MHRPAHSPETGSQEPAAIREKIRDLVIFAQDGYKKVFETESLTYLFIARQEPAHRAPSFL